MHKNAYLSHILSFQAYCVQSDPISINLRIMDHEVILDSFQICEWLLNLSWDHFSLHQEEISVTMTLELKVPKRHVVTPTLSTVMVQRVLW